MFKRLLSVSILFAAMSLAPVAANAATDNVAGVHATQQSSTCKGVVIDTTGEPVIGASILVKGTTTGTITDFDGNFEIPNVKKGATLVISFMGYETQEIVWNGQDLKVTLKDDSQQLEEVVVTALGIKKDAKKLGYAVSTIGADDLTKAAAPTLGAALYGKAAGVRIQSAPGGATGAISINVRGLSSITGNNQPLIVLDGVPIHNDDGKTNGGDYWATQRTKSNGLADINPEDIESMSILKGASASALYGSEAANGVVMITTKSGKGAKGMGVDFNASLTADFVAYMPKFQTTYGPGLRPSQRAANGCDEDGFYYREDRHGVKQRTTYPGTSYFGPAYDGKDVLYFDGTMRAYSPISANNYNNVFRTGFNQQYNVALTKGNENGNLRFSYTYVDNTPTQYNSDFNKHNFSLVGSQGVTKNVKVDYSVNYILEKVKNRPYRISRLTNNFGGMFGAFDDVNWVREHTMTSDGYKNRPYTSSNITKPEEGFEWGLPFGALVDEYYWNIYGREQYENKSRLLANVSPSWEIIPGLTLKGRIATDYTTEKIELMEHTETASAFGSPGGYYGINNNRYEIFYGDAMLTYDKNFTEKLGFNATVGYQARQENRFDMSAGTSGGLTVDNWFHLNASVNKQNTSQTKQDYLKTAVFGTASLSWDSWAYLEGTLRNEKISTLAPGYNSFTYPSVNASAIITELLKEKRPDWWNYGKVRVSYGIVGNAPAIYKSAIAYTQNSASGYTYNMMSNSVGNLTIHPEKKYEWEFGLEGKFFGNRLGFEMSYYTNTVKDQILDTTMPLSSGGSSILMNVGELKNQGLELSVYGTPIETKDFSWDLRANIAWNKNKVTKLADGLDMLQHANYDNGSVYLRSYVGESMGNFYSLAPATDKNGNYIIDQSTGVYKLTDDWVKVGNAMPDLTGGFATTLTYKNWSLDASLDFRVGGSVLNMAYQYMMGRGSLEESMQYRDEAHGGLAYYLDGTNPVLFTGTGDRGPNGEKVYHDGIILKGVDENGNPNQKVIEAGKYYNWTYNWGGYDPSDVTYYSHSVFKNSYAKVREVTLTYAMPKSITEKFNCNRLTLSVYGRNLFYLYKNLPIFDAEFSDATNWIDQACTQGSTATTRSFGFSLRASF